MAIDRDNTVHFAWVEGGGDHNGTVYYRKARAEAPGAPEIVHTPQGWNECDIAIDTNVSPVIAANTATTSQMAIYERTDSGWKQTILPSDHELYKWAPSIVSADGGRLYVAFRYTVMRDPGEARNLVGGAEDGISSAQMRRAK